MKESEFISLASTVAIPTEVKSGGGDFIDSFVDDPAPGKISDVVADPLMMDPSPTQGVPLNQVMDPEESAEVLIALVDSLQDIGFSVAYALKLKNKFSKEERDKIDEIDRKPESERTDEERHLESRFNKAMQKIVARKDALGFTDDERRQLKSPATLLIKKSGKDIPPGLAFALVTGKIIGDRMIDFVWE